MNKSEKWTVATMSGCVCGRGPTPEAAIRAALLCDEFTADELIAGDNETHTRASQEEIAAAIAAVDGPAARAARRDAQLEAETQAEEDRDNRRGPAQP